MGICFLILSCGTWWQRQMVPISMGLIESNAFKTEYEWICENPSKNSTVLFLNP